MCVCTPGMAKSFLLERPRILTMWLTISTSSMGIGWASRFCLLVEGVRGLDSVGKDTTIHRKIANFCLSMAPQIRVGSLWRFYPRFGDLFPLFWFKLHYPHFVAGPQMIGQCQTRTKKTLVDQRINPRSTRVFGDYKPCFFD